jgi:hypothetical protein
MFAVSRRYHFDPKDAEKIDCEIQTGFVPLLKKAPGFVAYNWLDNGQGVGESMTVFQSRAGAEGSVAVAKFWASQHLAGLLGSPEILQREVKAQARSRANAPPGVTLQAIEHIHPALSPVSGTGTISALAEHLMVRGCEPGAQFVPPPRRCRIPM